MPKRGQSSYGLLGALQSAINNINRANGMRRQVARGPIGKINRFIEREASSAYRWINSTLGGRKPKMYVESRGKRQRVSKSSKGTTQHTRKKYRVNTTGYAGQFNKNLRKVGKDMGMTHGSVYKYEKGGTEEAPKCIYIGHSAGEYEYEHRAFWESVMRHLVNMTGRQIQTMNDVVTGQVFLEYYDKSDTSAELKTLRFPVAEDAQTSLSIVNWAKELAIRLYNEIRDNREADFVFERIAYIEQPALEGSIRSVINGKSTTVVMRTASHLRMQNQTIASTGSSAANAGNATEVENNPLHGRMYQTTKGGFVPLVRPSAESANWEGFTPDGVGFISASRAGDLPSFLNKPPYPSFFKYASKYSSIYLAPGQIKSSHLYDVTKTTITGFLLKNRRLILALGGDVVFQNAIRQYRSNGPSKLFALEKLVDARLSSAPPLSIGWQLETRVSCAMFPSKWHEIPETVIDTVTPQDSIQ